MMNANAANEEEDEWLYCLESIPVPLVEGLELGQAVQVSDTVQNGLE